MNNQIRLLIDQREPFADGIEFGEAGAYERIKGRAAFAVDPTAPGQRKIVDLEFAPRNSEGLVEFAADILILKPVNMQRANRRLFYDYGNRANIRALQFFCDAPFSNDPSTLEHAGNGFLFRHGFTVAWCAWQGDVLPGGNRFLLDVPTARDGEQRITGRVRTEFIVEQAGILSFPLSGFASTHSYPAASLDTSRASVTRRRFAQDARELVAPETWQFARVQSGPGMDGQGQERGVVACNDSIYMPDGFAPGYIYELIYEAYDPKVMGLGFVAVRDFISHLRYDLADANGQANPLAVGNEVAIDKAYCWGRSQTGRLIRETVYQGFNADTSGRKVFDGVLAHVAGGGRMVLNHRFACGTDAAGQQLEAHDKAADRFPFAYASTTDHLTGQTDALLRHPETDPLVMHSQTGTEYWQRRGSLVHTDTQGNDLAIPDGVRVYLWSSTQHFADPARTPARVGGLTHALNRAQTSVLFRALLIALDEWATDGVEPPPSQIPTRADGTLVDAAEWRASFPDIPGAYLPSGPTALPLFDHGARLEQGFLDNVPPAHTGGEYVLAVPVTDADGIDLGGVKTPMVAAPLGTFTGWNIRSRRLSGHGAMFWFNGSFLPFANTATERAVSGDSRASRAERYATNEIYVEAVSNACSELVNSRLLLEEDVPGIVADARNWFAPWTVVEP